mgnify:CR=1 FL=1
MAYDIGEGEQTSEFIISVCVAIFQEVFKGKLPSGTKLFEAMKMVKTIK